MLAVREGEMASTSEKWGVPISIGAILVAYLIAAAQSHWFPFIHSNPTVHSAPRDGGGSTKSATATVTPSASGGGAGTIGNDGSPAIYHQGTLTLAFNTCADLDALPTDPQWGEPSANPDAGGADLCSESPSFVGVNSATLVTANSGTDTTCQNATGWLAPNLYQDLHLSVGSFVCVHTNQGRYSLLRVEAINSATNTIMFWAKTFKKPRD